VCRAGKRGRHRYLGEGRIGEKMESGMVVVLAPRGVHCKLHGRILGEVERVIGLLKTKTKNLMVKVGLRIVRMYAR